MVNEYDCTFLKLIDTVNDRMLPGTIGFASEQRHGDNWKTMRQVINANKNLVLSNELIKVELPP